MGLSIEKGHIAGLENFLLNMSLVVTLGLFLGFALRSLALLALDRDRPALVKALRALAAAAFLVCGYFDYAFSNNMLVLDRPPRAVLVALAVAFPFISIARGKKGSTQSPRARHAVIVAGTLFALCFFSVLTLLRAGTVALTGDRVTLTVDVTGETRRESPPRAGSDPAALVFHRVVIWLPSGARLGDFWLPGDRVRVTGRTLRLSSFLRGLGFPNLYQFASAESYARDPSTAGAEEHPLASEPFPAGGPLAVDARWEKIQASVLSSWENGTSDDSSLALRAVPNASPCYPLLDGLGRPLRKTFLLVLTPSGTATSRGSSPLEKVVPRSF